jgi:ferritin
MILSQTVLTALNDQLTTERFANAVYKSLEIAFKNRAWEGFAKWAHQQAKDERHHADRIIKYIDKRGSMAELWALDKPPVSGGDPEDGLRSALVLEQFVTERINALYVLCETEKDEDTCIMVRWFIDEQAKSEKELIDLLAEIERATDNASLVLMDKRFKK